MKKIAIIGSGEFQEPLIFKAKQLGYETHVFSLRNNTKGEKEADFFYDINILNKQKILEICQNVKIDGITTIASDITTGTVVYVAEKMGLIGNSSKCLEKTTNKYKMREALKEGNLIVPQYQLLQKEDNILDKIKKFSYPIIVKPIDRAGSRGVCKVNEEAELENAIKCAMKESFSKKVIVEEYVEGEEYSCECISVNGKHTRLAFTKKFTTGEPNFIETGHIQPVIFENQEDIEKTIFKALDSLDIKNGASHTEFKITSNDELKIIEIGARMAGDCIGSHLVELSTGIDYVKLVIDVALGNPIKLNSIENNGECGIKFICNPEDYEMLEKIESENKDIIVTKSNHITKRGENVTDSSNRWGWYIIKTNKNINKYF